MAAIETQKCLMELPLQVLSLSCFSVSDLSVMISSCGYKSFQVLVCILSNFSLSILNQISLTCIHVTGMVYSFEIEGDEHFILVSFNFLSYQLALYGWLALDIFCDCFFLYFPYILEVSITIQLYSSLGEME